MWNTIHKEGRTSGNWLGRLVYLCFRLFVLLLVLAPATVDDCATLMGFDMLIMVTPQDYPLTGVTLMMSGALVCGVSLIWLVWDLIFGERKVEVDKA